LTPPHHTYDIEPMYTNSYEGPDSKSPPPSTGHSTGDSTNHAAAIGDLAPPPDWDDGRGGSPSDGGVDGQLDGGASSLRENDRLPPRGATGELLPQVKSSQVKSSQVKSSQVKSSQIKSSQDKTIQPSSSNSLCTKSRPALRPGVARRHLRALTLTSWLAEQRRVLRLKPSAA